MCNRLKIIRLDLGINQEKFSKILRINRSDVSKLENGDKTITAHELLEISKLEHLNLDWLLTGNGNRWLDGRKEMSYKSVSISDDTLTRLNQKVVYMEEEIKKIKEKQKQLDDLQKTTEALKATLRNAGFEMDDEMKEIESKLKAVKKQIKE